MRFLDDPERKKILRTVLYGDQEFTQFELEIVHTPLFQRLYNLKQLGFADKVFPDATHSRFNHVLGVVEVVSQMGGHLSKWLERNPTVQLRYHDADAEGKERNAAVKELHEGFKERFASLRLMALLHDLTHAAFGHTLEDEVCVFAEKHDDPARQVRFFDGLLAQLIYAWRFELGLSSPDPKTLKALSRFESTEEEVLGWAEEVHAQLTPQQQEALGVHLAAFDYAVRLLLYLELAHERDVRELPQPPHLLISAVIDRLKFNEKRLPLVLHRDLFMIDMVGNTMCADLLDYVRRDPENAGLKVSFDTRFLRYLTLVSVGGESDTEDLSPTKLRCIRIAIQFFKEKMRHDVLSEMSMVLKTRYLISERVLFHPTKCAAGALLGTSAQLLGLQKSPKWMQVLGDQQFLVELSKLANNLLTVSAPGQMEAGRKAFVEGLRSADPDSFEVLSDAVLVITGKAIGEAVKSGEEPWREVQGRAGAASGALWRLTSRRLPKLAFRLRPGAHQSGGIDVADIAAKYTDPTTRYVLERRLEQVASLPMGSVAIHCPARRMHMKLAGVLVVGNDPTKVRRLRDVTGIVKEDLDPYEEEIQSVEKMYASIWQFQIFLDAAVFDKQQVLEWAILRELKGFTNDVLLSDELKREQTSHGDTAYSILMGSCLDRVAPGLLSKVVARLDHQPRFRGAGNTLETQVLATITAVQDEANAKPQQQELELGNHGAISRKEGRLDGK